MEKYPYLSDENKARSTSLLLACISVVLLLINFFVRSNILLTIALDFAIIFFGFAMHYLEYHSVQGQSIKKYILAFHCFAIHALMMNFAGFANEPGTLSFQVLHGLTDAFYIAALLTLSKIFKPVLSNTVIACLALVTFLLSLFNVNIVLNLVTICAGAYLLYTSYKDSLASAALGCLSVVLALVAIVGKNSPDTHYILHSIGTMLMMYVAYTFYDVVSPKVSQDLVNVSRTAPVEKQETVSRSVSTPVVTEEKPKTKTSRSTVKKDNYLKPDPSWFKKDYAYQPYVDILDAPVTAFKGVSDKMAKDLKDAFGIDTVRELAESKYFKWAKEIVEDAE